MKNPVFPIAFLFLISSSTIILAQENILEQLEEIAIIDQKVMMPMRDGIRLATDIYRPKTEKKVPIIFIRTPYNFNSWGDGEIRTGTYRSAYEAVERGYAYVIQNERGRYFSQGDWDILGTPTNDGYDAFSWMAKQPWSNGRIATQGCSSSAEWQMAVAALDHPAHVAMIPACFGAGVGRIGQFYEQGNWFRGGAIQLFYASWLYWVQNDRIRPTFPEDATQKDLIRVSMSYDLAPERSKVDWSISLQHLPVQDIIKNVNGPVGIYEDMIRRKPYDPDWYKGGLYHDDMDFGVPSLWIASWFDLASSPNLALFNHIRKNARDKEVRDNQYLIIAPTLHCNYEQTAEQTIVGELNVGDARLNYDSLTNGWYEYWLKGENNEFLDKMPRVHYFTLGMNRWQTADSWPPAGVEMTTYYLDNEARANSLNGDGRLTKIRPENKVNPDCFVYDPAYPVPSHGGNVCCTGNAITPGSFDQRPLEIREDILIYSTDPLKKGMEVSGFIETTLYVSSDAKDTDFTIKLVDVYPDGRAYNLDETILRARYREGFDKEVFMEDGKVYKIELSPMSTSNYFARGHRIRIEVSSSNFPRFDRNLNTGGNNYDESVGIVAHNKIHHSSDYPSQIRFPIIHR